MGMLHYSLNQFCVRGIFIPQLQKIIKALKKVFPKRVINVDSNTPFTGRTCENGYGAHSTNDIHHIITLLVYKVKATGTTQIPGLPGTISLFMSVPYGML